MAHLPKRPGKPRKPDRKSRRQTELQELRNIQCVLAKFSSDLEASGESGQFRLFSDLPISHRTQLGLETAHFVEMTEIQRLAVPAALAGRDVIGAAETGSGKTLAFLIPALERLYREGWTAADGLGALILAPTRELAIQIFQVLRRIGCKHSLSAGLVIGGKDQRAEREAIQRMNILVATPGRLLQHMDQAVGFEWSNLQMLVLDEADRILDLGFSRTVDAILGALPPPSSSARQTLLFSATQTASLRDLIVRLRLNRPIRLQTTSLTALSNAASSSPSAPQSTHQPMSSASDSKDDGRQTAGTDEGPAGRLQTPKSLKQFVLFSALPDKIDHLWAFVKGHLQAKTIVFVSSCKQVRFLFEALCRLQPGVPLLHLHGKQKQPRRMTVFADFCRRRAAVLIATDIAARGLDFPAVDWVVQLDCPEDVQTYVHRVGRTARYDAVGSSLLFLLQSEREMLRRLREGNGFEVASFQGRSEEKDASPRLQVRSKLQALCSQDPEIKYLGQKALISYVRSVFLSPDKAVFTVEGQPWEETALAMGLPGAPKLRFIDRQAAAKNASRDSARQLAEATPSSSEDGQDGGEDIDDDSDLPKATSSKRPPLRAIDKMFLKKNNDVLSEHYSRLRDSESDSDGELLQVKRRDVDVTTAEFSVAPPGRMSRRDLLKTKKKYRVKLGKERSVKHIFDEETGEAREAFPFQPEAEFDRTTVSALEAQFLADTGKALAEADAADKDRLRMARREKRLERKRKAREPGAGQRSSDHQVRLANFESE